MSSSKKQQSFSSYSEERCNGKEIQEEEGFSEYEEEKQSPKVKESLGVIKAEKFNLKRQRRRYSYGGNLEEKSITYNYLDPLNEIPNTRGTYYTAALKHPRQPKFINFAGSPCGIGSPFNNTSLFQYQQCYLSGLNKYYKSHNYIKKHQSRLSVASSVERNKQVERSLDRSEYWNGEKFDYLKERPSFQADDKKQKVKTLKQSKDLNKVQFERNLTSGLIVNKKQLKEAKAFKPQKYKQDTSNYIKIEEDHSNAKQASQAKAISLQKPIQIVKKNRQALMQRSVKQNIDIIQKPKETDLKFQPIQVRTKETILMQQEYSFLLAEKNQLSAENSKLKEIIKNKDIEIQSLKKQRIMDNNEYTGNIEKLKAIFQKERNQMIKQFESEISIYKSVRKEVIKSQLVKEEAEKIALIAEKNKLQDEVKRITAQLINLQKELKEKNYKMKSLQEKVCNLQNQFNLNNENRIQPKKAQLEKEKAHLKGPNKKQETSKPKEVIPEWINNFLGVFKNMVIKLLGSVDPSWSEKKTIIIGWKVVKIMIEKAVKIGIKVPEIINDDQVGECSLISHPEKSTGDIKKYNFNGSKKPIRV